MSVTHSGSVKRCAGWVSESAPGGSSRRFLVNPLGTVTGEQGALLLTRLGRAARLVREALRAVLRTLAGHFSARATAPGCEGGPLEAARCKFPRGPGGTDGWRHCHGAWVCARGWM